MQALYEISFAYGNINGPFSVYTLRPRICVSCDTSIGDVGEPAVLFVEECADGLDLLSPENQQVIYIDKISNYFFYPSIS